MPARTRAVFVVLIALAALIAAGAIFLLNQERPKPAPALTPSFTLTDQDGRQVTEHDFRGRAMLVFFGFTHCPDVCPVTLQKIADALELEPALTERLTPVFISVDPERDTPAEMKVYAGHFSPAIRALSGTPEQIRATLAAFKAYAKKVELPDSALGYTVDHSSLVYLYDAEGRFVTGWDPSVEPEVLAAALKDYVK